MSQNEVLRGFLCTSNISKFYNTIMQELLEYIPVPQKVMNAGQDGSLILFIGSGISKRLGLPSWDEFASLILEDLASEQLLNYNEISALKNFIPKLDPRKILSIAEIIARESKRPLNFKKHLVPNKVGSKIYDSLNSIGCTFVTTNYDCLLQPSESVKIKDDTPQIMGERVYDVNDLHTYQIDRLGNVIHLHGYIGSPDSMIIGVKQYFEHYEKPIIRNLVTHLFNSKTVVFIGYGLNDVELLEHIFRHVENGYSNKPASLFVIDGFFSHEKIVFEHLRSYYKDSLNVELLGYCKDRDNYERLDTIIEKWSQEIRIGHPPLSLDAEFFDEVTRNQ